MERAASAIYESRGLARSTGRSFDQATQGDRHYCIQDAKAALASVTNVLAGAKPETIEAPSFNEWFLSLPPERQAILRDEKWMLAETAYTAGLSSGRS